MVLVCMVPPLAWFLLILLGLSDLPAWVHAGPSPPEAWFDALRLALVFPSPLALVPVHFGDISLLDEP